MALAKKKPAAPKVPKFSSRAEEAEFWSAQSPLDFGEFSELASVPASGEPMHRLTLVLDGDMIERLGCNRALQGHVVERPGGLVALGAPSDRRLPNHGPR
jgi:hypothetical protein